MSDLDTTAITSQPTTAIRPSWLRVTGRWMITFAGFPIGGLVAWLIVGPVNTPLAAIAGGTISGLFLGVAQWWGLGRRAPSAFPWIFATTIGMAVGLTAGAAAVGYDTSLQALAVQGAINGLIVGAAQAFVLRHRLGAPALAWPPALAAIWTIGWSITTLGGIAVDEQFTVFGSFGAITVTALTVVVPLRLNR
jgi:hypothetical protein